MAEASLSTRMVARAWSNPCRSVYRAREYAIGQACKLLGMVNTDMFSEGAQRYLMSLWILQ